MEGADRTSDGLSSLSLSFPICTVGRAINSALLPHTDLPSAQSLFHFTNSGSFRRSKPSCHLLRDVLSESLSNYGPGQEGTEAPRAGNWVSRFF